MGGSCFKNNVSYRLLLGMFYDNGKKCKNDPNIFSGSLEVVICGELIPKFQMYDEQMLIVF